jgi:hypothetical protein
MYRTYGQVFAPRQLLLHCPTTVHPWTYRQLLLHCPTTVHPWTYRQLPKTGPATLTFMDNKNISYRYSSEWHLVKPPLHESGT